MRLRTRPTPTGFSIFGFGISFKWDETEREIVRRLVNMLEDKRVLFAPFEAEGPESVYASVKEIRASIQKKLDELPEGAAAAPHLRAMREQCHRFFMRTGQRREALLENNPTERMIFDLELGAFRQIIGVYLAILSRAYELPVHGALGKELPSLD